MVREWPNTIVRQRANKGATLLLFNSSQLAREPMSAFLHLEAILENQFCFFGDRTQFGMPAYAG